MRTLILLVVNCSGKKTEGVNSLRTRLAGRELALVWLGLRGSVLGLAGGTLGEVGLVPLPLRVREVVPLVVVERQAELALIAWHTKKRAESAARAMRIERTKNLGFCGGGDYLPRWFRMK